MVSRKKIWKEKMPDKDGFPKVLTLESRFPCYKSIARMGAKISDLIVLVNSSALAVIMKSIKKDKVIPIYEICGLLSRKCNVKACCTPTTGISIMTAANGARPSEKEGKRKKFVF